MAGKQLVGGADEWRQRHGDQAMKTASERSMVVTAQLTVWLRQWRDGVNL